MSRDLHDGASTSDGRDWPRPRLHVRLLPPSASSLGASLGGWSAGSRGSGVSVNTISRAQDVIGVELAGEHQLHLGELRKLSAAGASSRATTTSTAHGRRHRARRERQHRVLGPGASQPQERRRAPCLLAGRTGPSARRADHLLGVAGVAARLGPHRDPPPRVRRRSNPDGRAGAFGGTAGATPRTRCGSRMPSRSGRAASWA